MSFLERVRSENRPLAEVLRNERFSGIRKLVEDLYPDKAHFIFELLQNAEDAKATNAEFYLEQSRLIFQHDGRAFTEDDVWGITSIGKGPINEAMPKSQGKIGQFGVGFKAVFAYAETPRMWCPTFSFEIADLVMPTEVSADALLGSKTKFEFPFNNPKKPASKAYEEIRAGLASLSASSILFLTNIKSIRWSIPDVESGKLSSIEHGENCVEVKREADGEVCESKYYLRFLESVRGLPKRHLAIAFALDRIQPEQVVKLKHSVEHRFKITSADPGSVSIYFPAEKETSGLRFHLHAPFIPELSRASIKHADANAPLFLQLAELAASSLARIRDAGLLTRDFLAVLPNNEDTIPLRYQCIRDSIIAAMKMEPLTPTYSGSHAPAENLCQAKIGLKRLLTKDDLNFLIGDEDEALLDWSPNPTASKIVEVDRFLAALEIETWDVIDFAKLLKDELTDGRRYVPSLRQWRDGPDENVLQWIEGKSPAWLQNCYSLLRDASKQRNISPGGVRSTFPDLAKTKIVRLESGKMGVGNDSFFPTEEVDNAGGFQFVCGEVLSAGSSPTEKEGAKAFLESIGVRPVNQTELVKVILQDFYREDGDIPSNKSIVAHLRQFAAVVEHDSAATAIFGRYWIFEDSTGEWRRPNEIYLDSPYLDTGLHAFYRALGDHADRFSLSDRYSEIGLSIKKLVAFASAVGVRTQLLIEGTSCYGNPAWESTFCYASGNDSAYGTSEDYTIEGLEKSLKTQSKKLSSLVWKTLAEQRSGKWIQARYRKNKSQDFLTAPSKLVSILRSAAWIPQSKGKFVRPAEAERDLLPKEYIFSPSWKWLEAIEFGVEVKKRSLEHKKKLEVVAVYGFADEKSLIAGQWFAALDVEDRDRFMGQFSCYEPFDLPEHSPRNAERRTRRVADDAVDAPEKETELRTRSVPIGVSEIKKKADAYLRQQYTNPDRDMICQICKARLPFKLAGDRWYFESIPFLSRLTQLHYQNYLALCPNHAAMFQLANESKDAIAEQFAILDSDRLPIALAGKSFDVYFTETHRKDLQAVMQATEPSETTEDQ